MTTSQELQTGLSLADARRDAWSVFQRTPPPAKTVETWRRVDFNAWRLNLLADTPPPLAPLPLKGERVRVGGEETGILAQSGNEPGAVSLDPELARKGVILTRLEEAVTRCPDLVNPYVKSLGAGLDFRKLEAANLAQFRGGVFLYVPKGLRFEKPFNFSFLHDPANPFYFPRTLVIVEADCDVTIVEGHRRNESKPSSAGSKPSSVAFSQLVAGQGARVRYYYDQSLPLDAIHFWHQRVDLAQDAFLQHYSVLLGSAVHKSELDVRLNGKGARSELHGILFGSKNQIFDPHTVQWHSAPKSTSDLLFRVALKERARAIYTGLIRIEKEAVGCDAFQQNNNLILSNDARADTTPVLEILTDEVRCKHGATIGPVNPDELFYLCSRGLEPQEATKMLIMGFFDPILSRLPLGGLRDRISREIEQRLTK